MPLRPKSSTDPCKRPLHHPKPSRSCSNLPSPPAPPVRPCSPVFLFQPPRLGDLAPAPPTLPAASPLPSAASPPSPSSPSSPAASPAPSPPPSPSAAPSASSFSATTSSPAPSLPSSPLLLKTLKLSPFSSHALAARCLSTSSAAPNFLVLIQILLTSKGISLNPITSLYYVAPCCLGFLLIPWFIVEFPVLCATSSFRPNHLVFLFQKRENPSETEKAKASASQERASCPPFARI